MEETTLVQGLTEWTSVCLEGSHAPHCTTNITSACLGTELCWLESAWFNRCWDYGEFWISSYWDPLRALLIANFTVWHNNIISWAFTILNCCSGQEKEKNSCFSNSFIKSTSLVNFGLSSQEAAGPLLGHVQFHWWHHSKLILKSLAYSGLDYWNISIKALAGAPT